MGIKFASPSLPIDNSTDPTFSPSVTYLTISTHKFLHPPNPRHVSCKVIGKSIPCQNLESHTSKTFVNEFSALQTAFVMHPWEETLETQPNATVEYGFLPSPNVLMVFSQRKFKRGTRKPFLEISDTRKRKGTVT